MGRRSKEIPLRGDNERFGDSAGSDVGNGDNGCIKNEGVLEVAGLEFRVGNLYTLENRFLSVG